MSSTTWPLSSSFSTAGADSAGGVAGVGATTAAAVRARRPLAALSARRETDVPVPGAAGAVRWNRGQVAEVCEAEQGSLQRKHKLRAIQSARASAVSRGTDDGGAAGLSDVATAEGLDALRAVTAAKTSGGAPNEVSMLVRCFLVCFNEVRALGVGRVPPAGVHASERV